MRLVSLTKMARETGLEPAASAVTGRRKISRINTWPYFSGANLALKGPEVFPFLPTNRVGSS
jgi:hypothetical protein